ncbi:MAG: CAP domain-containing protein [Actinobacteria bacterium]|nr:CAP domain-containing protein [Actinomycetota bacterium]
MHSTLLRSTAALVTAFGLIAGLLVLTAAPAQAASFRVSVDASATTVAAGGTVTFTGTVSPRPSSRYVYLQRRMVGSTKWKTVKKIHTTRAGGYRVTVGTSSDADRYYRIYKPKQGSRKAGYSTGVQVIVDRVVVGAAASLTSHYPTTGALSGGTELTLTGSGLAGTTQVTFTPQVAASDTADGSGVLPELPGTVVSADDQTVVVTTPASLGGPSLVKVYTGSNTLTTTFTYAAMPRDLEPFEQAVLDEINARRAEAQTCDGQKMPPVEPLTSDGTLADLALSHSRDLAARQSVYKGISHQTYLTRSVGTRFALAGMTSGWGEILALSPESYEASDVVDQWINSRSGHCEALMSDQWTTAGVGVATGRWEYRTGSFQDSLFSNVDFS